MQYTCDLGMCLSSAVNVHLCRTALGELGNVGGGLRPTCCSAGPLVPVATLRGTDCAAQASVERGDFAAAAPIGFSDAPGESLLAQLAARRRHAGLKATLMTLMCQSDFVSRQWRLVPENPKVPQMRLTMFTCVNVCCIVV